MKINMDNLLSRIDVEKIVLFGSNTQDDTGLDIDLLIISDDFKDMMKFKREQIVISELKHNKKIDPICVTCDEYRRMEIWGNHFSKQILTRGVVIYER